MSAGRNLARIRSIAAAVGVGVALTAGAGHALADTAGDPSQTESTAESTAESSTPPPTTASPTTTSTVETTTPTTTSPTTDAPSTQQTAPTTTALTSTTTAKVPSSSRPPTTSAVSAPTAGDVATSTPTTLSPMQTTQEPAAAAVTAAIAQTSPPSQTPATGITEPAVIRVAQTLQVTTSTAPTPPPTTVPTQLVLGLLGLFGYNPYAAPNPGAPAPAPILEQIWVGWQQINRRLFNSYPTVHPTVTGYDPTTGTITGTIGGSDPDGDTLQYAASSPAHGTVIIDQATGTFSYTPSVAYAHGLSAGGSTTPGTDSITFSATDDLAVNGFHLHLLSATGPSASTHAVTVAVVPVNSAPTGTATGTLDATTGSTTYVLTTKDTDGDPVSVAVTAAPTHGDLKAVGGAYVYTPATAAAHAAAGGGPTSDTAVLTLSDGHGGSSTITLTPAIVATNTPPTITAVSTLNPPTSAAVPVSSTVSISTGDAEKDPVTVTVATAPAHGTLTQTSDTTWLYEPTLNYAHGLTSNGSDSVTFQASDGHGGIAYVTAPIVVAPQNQNPVGVVISTTQTSNTTTTYQFSLSDPDKDTVSQTVTTTPSHGTYDATTGVYTADTSYAHGLSAGGSSTPGSDLIVLTLGDGHGGSSTITLTPAINPVNSPPTYTQTHVVTDSSTNTTTWTATVADSDGDQILRQQTQPSHGTVSISAVDGKTVIVYTADPAYAQTIRGVANDAFSVTFDDQHGGVTTQNFSASVTPVNLPPSIAVSSSSTTTGSVTTYVLATSDPNGDAVTVSVGTLPTNGTVKNTPDGWVYTPNTGYAHALWKNGTTTPVTDSFTLVASDGRGGTTSLTLTPSVTPVNSAPAGSLTGTLQTDGTTLILGNPFDPDGDSFDFGVTTNPLHGTISAGKGGYVYTPDPTYVQGLTQDATDSVVFTADDHLGGVNTYTVPLTIAAPAASINLVSSGVNTSTYVVATKSGNPPTSYSLTVQNGKVVATPTGFVFTVDPTYAHSLSLNGSTTPGTATFSGSIQVGSEPASPFVFHPVATPVNTPPTLSLSTKPLDDGTTLITSSTTDNDSDPVTVTLVKQPSHGTVAAGGGGYIYTPDAAYVAVLTQNSTDTVQFTADDGHGGKVSSSVDVTIVAPPAATVTATSITGGNTTYTVSSKSGATPSFTIVTATNGTVTTTSTGFVFTPDPTYAHSLSTNGSTTPGSGTVVVGVPDGAGGTQQLTVTPSIAPVNSAPTISVIPAQVLADGLLIPDPTGEPITYTALSNISGANYLFVVDTNGIASLVDPRRPGQTFEQAQFPGALRAVASSSTGDMTAFLDQTGVLYRYYRGDFLSPVTIGSSVTSLAIGRDAAGQPVVVAVDPTAGKFTFVGVDGATGSVPTILKPSLLVASPTGSTVYAIDPQSGVIDLVYVISRGVGVFGGAAGAQVTSGVVSPDGRTVYLGSTSSLQITKVGQTYADVVSSVPGIPVLNVSALALSPNGRWLYMTVAGNRSVQVFDTTTMTYLGSTPTLRFVPNSIVAMPDGSGIVVSGGGQAAEILLRPGYVAVTSDRDNDPVSVAITGTSLGIPSSWGNGFFTFTPIGSPSSFTLTASDGHGGSTSVTTTV